MHGGQFTSLNNGLRGWRLIALGLAVWASSPLSAQAFEPIVEYAWGPIRCRSEVLLPDADSLQGHLEGLPAEVAEALALPQADRIVEIHVYASRRRYRSEIGTLTADVRRQRGVFLIRDETIRIYTFQQKDLAGILRHEATHAMLHEALPYVPLWLDEGLASSFELDSAAGRGGNPFRGPLRLSLQLGWRPDVEKLERIRRSADLDIGDYRHAWGWVYFLQHESEESREALRGYLANIANGQPPQPFSQYLAQNLPDAQDRFVRFFQR